MCGLQFLVIPSLLISSFAQAGRPSVRWVKVEPVAASGVFTPKTSEDEAQNVLKRFDVNIVNGSDSNKLALSRGLLELEKLGGGRFRPAEGATFKILQGRGCAQQLGQTIVLHHGCGSLDSVAYYMHELGHYIGNNDHAKLYGAYKSTVSSRCAVSGYSMKDWTRARARNEEFAEVIAAYLTHPALLLSSGPSCVKAYNFFRDQVFDGTVNSADPIAAKEQQIRLAKADTKTILLKEKLQTKTVLDAKPAAETKPVADAKAKAEVKSAKVADAKVKSEPKALVSVSKDAKAATSKLKPTKISYTEEEMMKMDNCSESSVVDDKGLDI